MAIGEHIGWRVKTVHREYYKDHIVSDPNAHVPDLIRLIV